MLSRLELERDAKPNFTVNLYWYLVIDTIISRMNIRMLLPEGLEHLTFDKRDLCEPYELRHH